MTDRSHIHRGKISAYLFGSRGNVAQEYRVWVLEWDRPGAKCVWVILIKLWISPKSQPSWEWSVGMMLVLLSGLWASWNEQISGNRPGHINEGQLLSLPWPAVQLLLFKEQDCRDGEKEGKGTSEVAGAWAKMSEPSLLLLQDLVEYLCKLGSRAQTRKGILLYGMCTSSPQNFSYYIPDILARCRC